MVVPLIVLAEKKTRDTFKKKKTFAMNLMNKKEK